MENKETRQKKDGEDMKKGLYADGQSKHVDANSENIIEEKDIIKEEKILTFTGKKVRETVGWFNFDKKYLKVCLYALFVIFWGAIIFIIDAKLGCNKGIYHELFRSVVTVFCSSYHCIFCFAYI